MAAHLPDAAKTVEVSLLGRTYRVACEDDKRQELMEATLSQTDMQLAVELWLTSTFLPA